MTTAGMITEREKREQICKKLGLGNIVQAHRFIAASAVKGADPLMRKGVRATALIDLGYAADALRKLGYTSVALEQLGFDAPDAKVKSDPNILRKPLTPVIRKGEGTAVVDQLRTLIDSGMRAEGLLSRGYNAVICRKAGISAAELTQLGFDLHNLRAAYPLSELRRAGYNAMDLRRFYSGADMLMAGFSAAELRSAGFTPRQLLSFGYQENAVVTAGYSTVELTGAGLSKRTVDRRGFQ